MQDLAGGPPRASFAITAQDVASGGYAPRLAGFVRLGIINLGTDFRTLDAGIDVRVFWIETAGMLVYWLWLVVFHFRSISYDT
jgi:hypothetical protein